MSPATPLKVQPPSTEKVIFWSMALLLLGQMTWWITFQVHESRRLMAAQIETMRGGRALAWQMDMQEIWETNQQNQMTTFLDKGVIVGREIRYGNLEARKARIEQRFPYVAVVHSPVEPDDPVLADPTPTYLTFRRDTLAQMERDRRSALWRVTAQAVAMVGIVLLGMAYIYRRLNVEMELMLRQRNFIAAVTHELKTPIASLRVWVETLFMRTLAEDRRERIQMLMDGDLTRLTDLVNNMLDVARADAGRLEVLLEPTVLGPWLRAVCETMDHRLGQGLLGLQLKVDEELRANIDPRLFGAVMDNLLSNAFKYSSAPRETLVTLEGDPDRVILSVTDRGWGFDPHQATQLFQRFYRVGDEMTRQVSGTGLGLYLSREIVTRHRGSIQAFSLGPDRGATFTVRIPRLPR
jgi:signal transduction histidine kinase